MKSHVPQEVIIKEVICHYCKKNFHYQSKLDIHLETCKVKKKQKFLDEKPFFPKTERWEMKKDKKRKRKQENFDEKNLIPKKEKWKMKIDRKKSSVVIQREPEKLVKIKQSDSNFVDTVESESEFVNPYI